MATALWHNGDTMNKSAASKPAIRFGLSLAFAALFALVVRDLRAEDAFSSSLAPSPDTVGDNCLHTNVVV